MGSALDIREDMSPQDLRTWARRCRNGRAAARAYAIANALEGMPRGDGPRPSRMAWRQQPRGAGQPHPGTVAAILARALPARGREAATRSSASGSSCESAFYPSGSSAIRTTSSKRAAAPGTPSSRRLGASAPFAPSLGCRKSIHESGGLTHLTLESRSVPGRRGSAPRPFRRSS